VIDDTEQLTGRAIGRVFLSGQKRGVFGVIKRELRRRSAIEAVIGHLKNDGHFGRCFLKGRHGDAANVILNAVGYNLRLILKWLRALLCLFVAAFSASAIALVIA
jgi:IS5 family transposase